MAVTKDYSGYMLFFFENGKLKSYAHPYREYILPKMLFQGLTRTRERLAILVYDNPPLFEELLSIAMNLRRLTNSYS